VLPIYRQHPDGGLRPGNTAGSFGKCRMEPHSQLSPFPRRNHADQACPAVRVTTQKRKSPPKICLSIMPCGRCWLQEIVPLDVEGLRANSHLTDLAGHLAESVLGYFFASIPSLDIAHFPARGSEPEVDFILTVGTRRSQSRSNTGDALIRTMTPVG